MNNLEQVDQVFKIIETELTEFGFEFERVDFNRPWGGFFVINEQQAQKFITRYYPEDDAEVLTKGGRVSPKILVVLPGKRLSWQYHHRRSEVWKLVEGEAGLIRSLTDEQNEVQEMALNEKVVLAKGERHRLVGLNKTGVIAEIWQHSDPHHLSDEEDIVRLQDDFGR